jgi:hypothetical protein
MPPDVIAQVVSGLDDFRNLCAEALASAAAEAEIADDEVA